MHAREDNPELIRAKELNLKIYSYPEYIYQATKDKTRIVVGGSHGKTTITAMILHVFKSLNIDTDYMVGAQLEGFNTMVKLTNEAKYAVIEGDEYLASPIDRRPKFHLYHPNVAILSGIAWDHINVFPTFQIYVEQFEKFINLIEPNGSLIYCNEDSELKKLAENHINSNQLSLLPYSVPNHKIIDGTTYIITENEEIPLMVFGHHNLLNLNAARLACNQIGIKDIDFFNAIKTFKGAAKRLELVYKNDNFSFYKDFAHSPSKLKATIDAVKKQFEKRKVVACMELHTFSSLNENFLKEYNGSMDMADEAIVYFNPYTIAHKKLKPITEQDVYNYFNNNKLIVFTKSEDLINYLLKNDFSNQVLLMMSSGNFDGIKFEELAGQLKLSKS
jgi:UDP-N-acetylmuramate: L-alanyl-gamma-D-glutamyl-meso-diaminopimelate ligase